jgi:uncharacterized protein YegL
MPKPDDKRISSKAPMHIILLADNSGSMRFKVPPSDQTAAELASFAIQQWVAALQARTQFKKPYFKFSLILFENGIDVWCRAADVNGLNADNLGLEGVERARTNMSEALDEARTILETTPTSSAECPPYVFLYSDGRPDDEETALAAADRLKQLELPSGTPTIVTIGFGNVDEECLTAIASGPEFFKKLPTAVELLELLPRVGTPRTTVADFKEALRNA